MGNNENFGENLNSADNNNGVNYGNLGDNLGAPQGMNNSNNMSSILPLMMIGGNGFTDMFDGMFDFDFSDDEIEDSDTDKED